MLLAGLLVWVLPGAQAQDTSGWVRCAQEYQYCVFSGVRQVRYGVGSPVSAGMAELTLRDGTPCTNAVFGNPAYGIIKSCWVQAAAPVAASAGSGATGWNPPVIFNATISARAGDVVGLQGENFGAAPVVTLDNAQQQPLAIVHRVGTTWLAVQLPTQATGPLTVRVRNGTGISAPVAFDTPRPLHLDATLIVPGGLFRIIGHNLWLPGSTPRVTVNGLPATLDLRRSDEHMLQVVAPASLIPGSTARIVVEDGRGSPGTSVPAPTAVAAGALAEPYGLGLGWARAFAPIDQRRIVAADDPRLPRRVVCDGRTDVTSAVQAAIDLAAVAGGTVVLPAGRCRLAGSLRLHSRVALQGQGKTATELAYEANYPLQGIGLDLVAVRDLMLTNAGGAEEGPLLKQNTRLVLQRLTVRLQRSRQMYLSDNRDIALVDSDIQQTASISHQGPYVLAGCAGLVFQRNNTRWVDGAPAFSRVHDSVVLGNRFTRDGAAQQEPGTVHSMVIDFAYRIAVLGNVFDVADGPITQTRRNDGETILTEGGGGRRTEAIGSVVRADRDTLVSGTRLNADPFGEGAQPENLGIAIVAGKGMGQTRRIAGYSWPTVQVDRAWDVVPDATSRFASFVWGLEHSLIKGNRLLQNPRGIWLYHTAVRDVAVLDNTIVEGGGIYLRSYQNTATQTFTPIYNVLIARNRLSNSQHRWMSYINAVFVNADTRAYGAGLIGVDVRDNVIAANRPNLTSSTEEYANVEGYMAMMRIENAGRFEPGPWPPLLGALFARNQCQGCEASLRTGTGATGTTVMDAGLLEGAPPILDWATGGTTDQSTDTLIR